MLSGGCGLHQAKGEISPKLKPLSVILTAPISRRGRASASSDSYLSTHLRLSCVLSLTRSRSCIGDGDAAGGASECGALSRPVSYKFLAWQLCARYSAPLRLSHGLRARGAGGNIQCRLPSSFAHRLEMPPALSSRLLACWSQSLKFLPPSLSHCQCRNAAQHRRAAASIVANPALLGSGPSFDMVDRFVRLHDQLWSPGRSRRSITSGAPRVKEAARDHASPAGKVGPVSASLCS